MIYAYTDGASRGNPGPGAAAYVLVRDGRVIDKQGFYLGYCTNNEAEYTAVLKALEAALRLGEREVVVVSDSKLVVSQLKGVWAIRNPRMAKLNEQVRSLISSFSSVKFENVRRSDPFVAAADSICNEVLDREQT
ncbi:ribonuclease HI family protein [Tardisphaera miroshnichenkoae]